MPLVRRFRIVDGAFTEVAVDDRIKVHAKWPVLSDAAGVNPAQIPEAKRELAAKGVKVDFTNDGRAIFTDPKHRREVCRAMGLFDRNGGYGDPQRQS